VYTAVLRAVPPCCDKKFLVYGRELTRNANKMSTKVYRKPYGKSFTYQYSIGSTVKKTGKAVEQEFNHSAGMVRSGN